MPRCPSRTRPSRSSREFSAWCRPRAGPSPACRPNGELDSLFGSHADGKERAALTEELRRQRIKAPTGPRIAATLGSLEDFASGITLVLADARSNFGILMLLRTAALGPFTSTEIRMLTFALDAVSDRLSALRMQSLRGSVRYPRCRPATPCAARNSEGAFYVLDTEFRIVLAWTSEDQRRIALTGLHTHIAERLPAVLEDTVRELTAAWSSDSPTVRSRASGSAPRRPHAADLRTGRTVHRRAHRSLSTTRFAE